MKIHFNPFYDGEIFLSDSPKAMGETWLGLSGLLDQLELRLGIHCSMKSASEREADYLNAVRPHIAGTVFTHSMEVDPVGVASKLLGWRDALVMAGWDGSCPQSGYDKLGVLSSAEKDFYSPGTADRWKSVCRECEHTCLRDSIQVISVECPVCELPFLVKRTLKYLSSSGTNVDWKVKDDEVTTECKMDVSNVHLVRFSDINDAYEWISRVKELPRNTVVINRDAIRLNHTLATWDRPQVRSSVTDSNPQLLQLFKLSMSIFSHPLDIRNLLSYLQLPVSPIPSALRRKLAKHLLRTGGFGETSLREDGQERDEWDEIIRTSEAASEKIMPFLRPIREDHSKGVRKTEIVEYAEAMIRWLHGYREKAEISAGQKEQVTEVLSLFNSLVIAIQSLPDVFSYEELYSLIHQIYKPMDCQIQHTHSGAMNVVRDIRSIASAPDTLIWLDCHSADVEKDAFEFLSEDERSFLKSTGAGIPDFKLHLTAVRSERIRHLNMMGNVILVSSSYDGTSRLGEHPVFAEARLASAAVCDPDMLPVRSMEQAEHPVDRFEPHRYVELGELDYEGRTESYTSLETLINRPFNYVVEYLAKLPGQDDGQLKTAELTLGLVAHSFFEHIIAEGNKDLTQMRRLVNEQFDERVEAAVNATGLLLRLPDNATRYHWFRTTLKESMMALLDIMEHLNLTPVGCEVAFPEDGESLTLDDIGSFGARIDFLMARGDDYVIFDFKWSSSKRYEESLRADTSLQLELYRQTVKAAYPDRNVAGVGYFLMPRRQLVTSDFDAIPQSRLIVHVNGHPDSDLFGKIRNSYRFRMDEISRGHIEEGEMMDFYDVGDSYAALTEERSLCPVTELKVSKATNVKPSEDVFRPNRKGFRDRNGEPSETATSHAVLKGRLK